MKNIFCSIGNGITCRTCKKILIYFLVNGKILMWIVFKLSIDISLSNENKAQRTTMIRTFKHLVKKKRCVKKESIQSMTLD